MKVEITGEAVDAVVIHEMKYIVDRPEFDVFVPLNAKEKADEVRVKKAAKVILEYYGG